MTDIDDVLELDEVDAPFPTLLGAPVAPRSADQASIMDQKYMEVCHRMQTAEQRAAAAEEQIKRLMEDLEKMRYYMYTCMKLLDKSHMQQM